MEKLVTLVNTNQARPAIAPIAFDYLHGPLVRAGFRVELLDLCFSADFRAAIAAYCRASQPDFWGVTLRNTDDAYFASLHSYVPFVKDVVQTIKRHSPAPVIMGGIGFSIMPEKILEHCAADFGIVCEGEVSLPLLLHRLAAGQACDDVPGLVYRAAGQLKRNPVSFGDLVAVGAHSRTLIDNPKYFVEGGLAAVETSRGCDRACLYCIEPLAKGRQVRLRDPVHVVDEMESLADQGVNVLHLTDSEINLNLQHALAVCQAIHRRRLQRRIQWYAYAVPIPFTAELARCMRQAGCAGVNFGVDNASARMLRTLRRAFRPEHIAQVAETCRRQGLTYILEVLFGAPGETGETVRETIEFFNRINAEKVAVNIGLRIFPHTGLEQIARAEGISPANPNLSGATEDNDDLFYPIYYISAHIAPNPFEYITRLIGDDARYLGFHTDTFTYNANRLLIQALQRGEKGSYWSILSRAVERERAAAVQAQGKRR